MFDLFYAIRLYETNRHPVVAHCMLIGQHVLPEMHFDFNARLAQNYVKCVSRMTQRMNDFGCQLMRGTELVFCIGEIWPKMDHVLKMWGFDLFSTCFEIICHLEFLSKTRRIRWLMVQIDKLTLGHRELMKYLIIMKDFKSSILRLL